MVEDPIRPVVVGVGPADDADNRKVLAVRAGDGVDDAQTADGEGHDARADAPGPSVPVGGVPGVELVAAADVSEPGLGYEVVEESEVEVAGNGEDVADADLHEAPRDVAAEGGVGGGRGEWDGVVDGGDGAVSGGSSNVGVGGLA